VNLDGSKVEYVIPPGGTYLPKQIQVGPGAWTPVLVRPGRFQNPAVQPGWKPTGNPDLRSEEPGGHGLDYGGRFLYFSDKNAQTIQRAPMSMPPAARPPRTARISKPFSPGSRAHRSGFGLGEKANLLDRPG